MKKTFSEIAAGLALVGGLYFAQPAYSEENRLIFDSSKISNSRCRGMSKKENLPCINKNVIPAVEAYLNQDRKESGKLCLSPAAFRGWLTPKLGERKKSLEIYMTDDGKITLDKHPSGAEEGEQSSRKRTLPPRAQYEPSRDTPDTPTPKITTPKINMFSRTFEDILDCETGQPYTAKASAASPAPVNQTSAKTATPSEFVYSTPQGEHYRCACGADHTSADAKDLPKLSGDLSAIPCVTNYHCRLLDAPPKAKKKSLWARLLGAKEDGETSGNVAASSTKTASAVTASTSTAKAKETYSVGRPAHAYLKDLRAATRLMKGDEIPYSNCFGANRIASRAAEELEESLNAISSGTARSQVSTSTLNRYLDSFRLLKEGKEGNVNECMKQYREEKLARYRESGLLLRAGLEVSDAGAMPVAGAGVKRNGWTYSALVGKVGSKPAPRTTSSQTNPDTLGFYKQRLDSYDFNLEATRLALDVARDLSIRGSLSAGLQYDSLVEDYNGLQTIRTLRNGSVLATQQREDDGQNTLNITAFRLGVGYKVTSNTSVNGTLSIPFGSKETAQGNKYGRISGGATLNYQFGGAPVRGYFQRKTPAKN